MTSYSPAKKIGELLTKEFKKNPHFYFFSPDETTSNKFDEIFTAEKRAWGLATKTWDLPESPDGRNSDHDADRRRSGECGRGYGHTCASGHH